MRKPSWETAPGALAAFLSSHPTQASMVDVHTVTLTNGTTLRWVNLDQDVTLGHRVFKSGPGVPIVKRGRTRLTVGVSVDDLDVTLQFNDEVKIDGTPIATAIREGLFFGATWVLERAFIPDDTWQAVGAVVLFAGRVGGVKLGRTDAQLTVVSHLELLDTMVPAELFQSCCRNTLYDGNCGVNRAARSVAVVATSNSDEDRTAFAADWGAPAGQSERFELGVVTCTTGANAGTSRTIRNLTLQAGTTWLVDAVGPWPRPVTVGDGFTIAEGCDKNHTTCRDKFNNLARFRGEPWVPAAEMVT